MAYLKAYTYSDVIVGDSKALLVQFNPPHTYAVGAHGSPCQFLVTPYIVLMFLIASTNVLNAYKKLLKIEIKNIRTN